MIVDRRTGEWDSVRAVFSRVVTLFPARIREVYLLCHHADRAAATAQLVEEFLLDFEVVHVDEPEDLLRYVETKCLPQVRGIRNFKIRCTAGGTRSVIEVLFIFFS